MISPKRQAELRRIATDRRTAEVAACAVADAWSDARPTFEPSDSRGEILAERLDALESATRSSTLRKVFPVEVALYECSQHGRSHVRCCTRATRPERP